MKSQSISPVQTPLSVDFLVVGGGIAGLSVALGLTRIGHRVLVLEKGDGISNVGHGGIRAPPNMSKVLYRWGLKPQLREVSLASHPILFSKFQTGEIIGVQLWDAELLKETQGEFLLMTHAELYKVMYNAAVTAGAKVRTDAEVVEIDAEQREVRLASGEVLSADVIIGADGERGICRRLVLGRNERVVPSGMSLFDATYSTKLATETMPHDMLEIVNIEGNTVFMSFGNGCAATGYPVVSAHLVLADDISKALQRNYEEIAFQFFLRDEGEEGFYGDPPSTQLRTLLPEVCDPRLRAVGDHASNAIRVAINQYEDLEDWVDDSGHLLLVGQAAHPIAPGAIQGAAMALEDAAVLAKLFSHLTRHEQIESFLCAFQDIRQKRCEVARQSEVGLLALVTMEDGPEQEARDKTMQTRYRAGKNVFDSEDGENGVESEQWVEIRTIFGYDCEDEADNWWVQWGQLRERAKQGDSGINGIPESPNGGFWGAMTIETSTA
ncbi:FAD/NAD(P)-binding domain-containing protein [Laetiporus sulphureus 93-53]|uniref:FAD/NAD(P)-binding domain-containing protein n=1 Tax=Laetiporus sulphureus 93-53 TaxID=1314785 RepID=A0A165G3J6_9APHY|nr:FAD/NAD(P)-binding domain-containing protein [Laetiporus sulphureus 93-53]KZT09779.1 FAD/NAD(P)-binding domain-containing protein [Laetiporus sulphureus 93-53]